MFASSIGQRSGFWSGCGQLMARSLASVRRMHRVHRGTRQLLQLNDAMLKDIGLSRGEIEHAARTGRRMV
jgi:uncharacterized protein YjiS (DUF1127 family)